MKSFKGFTIWGSANIGVCTRQLIGCGFRVYWLGPLTGTKQRYHGLVKKVKYCKVDELDLKGCSKRLLLLVPHCCTQDPRRVDLIAALGETTGKPAFERVLERIKNNPKGRQAAVVVGSAFGALTDPRRADLIAALGENTGKPAFEKVLRKDQKQPRRRENLWDQDTSLLMTIHQCVSWRQELAYVAIRACEVHDFWHTLFDLPTNLISESALKVIEFEQMYLPMCLLSVVGGTTRFNGKKRAVFFKHYLPWGTRAGRPCTDLMFIYYEQHFHEDLA
ncbi:hypothetical protein C5167_024832 [Papaver somniferum]|uniref:Coenzyme Q biosynthesis protein 4 homolog n=1 Tax=Papaver somniferum TaxID=3469 RepID=A0A4Y7JSZ5_PAPSO|nr:hypothetical protein C5167_024832 [Papaver somniferum]